MTGTWTTRSLLVRNITICIVASVGFISLSPQAHAVVIILDGFGDADRNNDGVVDFYDTDLNNSGTWNDPVEDMALIDRGITEVTAATDPNDIGIIWSGIRSYDTAANIPKGDLAIINDSVAIGSETASQIHNDGLALSVESRGGGSSIMGRFPQPVQLGLVAGDKIVVSVDFRSWSEANIPFTPPDFNELRWGLFEDTDDELGMTAPRGSEGATVEWGRDDGNWFGGQPGAEGDKGIRAQLTFGSFAAPVDARLQWEYNLAGINGTNPTANGSNGRILEGNGVSDTPAAGGDTGTIANPTNPEDGPGGIIHNGTPAPHKLSMEFLRLENGLMEVASFVDGVEVLRDDIKDTDTGFALLGPPAFSYDYVAFRNSADFDYVLDNFMVEIFGSNAGGFTGDYNNNGTVDAADYVVWRNAGPTDTLPNDATPGTVDATDYTVWRANFGKPPGAGGGTSSATVPEPANLALLVIGGLLASATRWRYTGI